jgi:16S rRNA (guanine527-N7)-methyltransferase
LEINQLKLALQQRNLHPTDGQISKFEQFAQLVYQASQLFNLTAHHDVGMIFEKGIYDSLCFPNPYLKASTTWIDVGSGAGFPGIPLAILYPQIKMTLLEPTQKKATFLNQVVTKLQLANVNVVSQRAEILARGDHFQPVDGVVVRAVAPLRILVELVMPLLKVNGQALIYKGKDYLSEIALAKHALSTLGVEVTSVLTHRLPTEHEERALIIIQKSKPTPPNYPRMFSQIKKTPL